MAHKLLDGATATGISRVHKCKEGANTLHTVMVQFREIGMTDVSALVVKLQGSLTGSYGATGVTSKPVLAIGSTAEQVANGAFTFRINNTNYSKGAVSAGTALATGYAITTTKYGVVMVYISAAGTITYQYPAVTQAYATAALAMDAGDAMETTSDLCYIGRVLVYNNTGSEWNSQTDSFTDSDDVTTAIFIDASMDWYDVTTITFDATSLGNQGDISFTADKPLKYVRLNLSTLTGAGSVDAWYEGW